MSMTRTILLVFGFIQYVLCSGSMQIRLKSEHRQNATIIVSHGSNPTYIALPVTLQAAKIRDLGTFPVNFGEQYKMSILGGKVEDLALQGSSYSADFTALRGRLAPKQMHLPMSGLEIIFKCDENFTGSLCDTVCDNDDISCESPQKEQSLNITTDYDIDMEKLPQLVERLKESMKVDNELGGKAEELKRRNQDDEVSDNKKINPAKSIFENLFKTIFDVREKMNRINSEEREEPMPMLFKSLTIGRSKEEEDGIEKHGSAQRSFGMRHQKPSGWGGPGEGIGSILGPMTSLMSMMPRIARNSAEGSGEAMEDFVIDQIINN